MGVESEPEPGHGRGRVVALVAGAVVLVVVLVFAGYVVWDRNFRTAGAENPGTDCPGVVKGRSKNPLAAIGVDKVALIGDSIMFQSSCSIAESLAGVGITTSRHGVSGTGLLAGADWVAEARRIVEAEKPDIVVAIFVGNYIGTPVRDAAGNVVQRDTPEFFSRWQQRAEMLSQVVRDGGAELYWVSPPPIGVAPLAAASRLFEGYEKIPDDHVLHSGEALAGPEGQEVGAKESCGEVRFIRTGDAVHLTDDGARIYGQQIAHDLTADIGVLTTPKPC
jgi:hypothetical protein